MPQLDIRKAVLLQHHYPFDDKIDERVKELRNFVVPFDVLENLVNLQYSQPVIDVYVHGQIGACSDPMLIGKDSLIPSSQLMVHELIHRLLSKNTKGISEDDLSPSLYPNETELCARHVVVHAIHKYLYLHIFKQPELLQKDIKGCQVIEDYKQAWEIVEEQGYKNIIERWKSII